MIHGNWLAWWALNEPDKTALVDLASGRSFSYRALNARADRAAHLLREQFGIKKGDRVGVLGANRVEQVDLLFAAAKLGAILVPINWRLAPAEVNYILEDARPAVLVYGEDVAATVSELSVTDLPCLALDDDRPEGFSARLQQASEAAVSVEGVTEQTPLFLLYTSGTTGRPKGAILTHGTVTWNAINTATAWDLHHDDVTLTHTPFFHTGGWNVLTLPLLHRGGTVVLASRFDPSETLRAVERYRITVLFAVPTMFQMMLDAPEFGRADLRSLRFCISGGAPCPIPLIEAWQRRGVVFKQGYGLTEVGPNCFVLHERDAVTRAGSVGHPVLHLEARIVDPSGHEVEPGVVGELQLRGPTVTPGYWQNPEATRAALGQDGWFATGDLFLRDEEGYHYVVGRLKEMFISGGENVYPAEVERVLYEMEGVVEAAVVGVPDPKWGEVGHAFLAFNPTMKQRPSEAEMLDFCRARLARYKVPKRITVLNALPKGPSGKIQKSALGVPGGPGGGPVA